MTLPQFVLAALNKNAGEKQNLPFHFVMAALPVYAITPAQVNATAGFSVIPGSLYSQSMLIHSFRLRVNTAGVGAVTDLRLQTTDATPVVVATFAQAQLTSGAVLSPMSTGVTLGAGFCVKLTPGIGLVLIKTGSAATGSFTLDLIPLEMSFR